MFWNVASARDEISLSKWSGGSAHLRTFRGSFGCTAAENALGWQQSFFFTHACLMEESFAEKTNRQRAAKPVCCVNTRFFLRKMLGTNPAWICRDPISLILGTRFSLTLGTRSYFSLILGTRFEILGTRIGSLKRLKKPCQYKYGKECKFYIKWCAVTVSMKFLFDFLVPENLDSMLLQLCEVTLSSVHFSGVHDGLILRTSLQRKKFAAICYALYRNEFYTGILNSGIYFLEPVARI